MYENNVNDKILVYCLNMQRNIKKCWRTEELVFFDSINLILQPFLLNFLKVKCPSVESGCLLIHIRKHFSITVYISLILKIMWVSNVAFRWIEKKAIICDLH